MNRIGATTTNTYGTAADFGNNQGNGDNYIFNTDYAGKIWSAAACADPPACTEPLGDADSIPGVSTDTVNKGQYFTSTTSGAKTNLSYAFTGLSLTGVTWRLTVTDAADPNVGSYIGWQISIVTSSTPVPVSLSAVAGSPQSTAVSTSFANALQAKVTDTYGNPIGGVTVTFSAPTSGASATFSGAASASALTNASGIAISPVPLANATAGAYSVTATATGLPSASFSLTNTAVAAPTTFTTYLGTYGSGAQTYSGNSTILPLRGYIPGGASQMALFWTNLTPTSGGSFEYQIWADSDGAGNYILHLYNGTANAPAWPYLTMNPSGSTITLPTPIALGTLQITAYRFALVGNEFQLDLSVTRSGTFSDQIVIWASYGTNYSNPWGAVDGVWSANSVSAPAVTLSPTALTFGNQAPGASTSQTVTVTNSGSAALSITGLKLTGTNPGDFTATGCTASVAPGNTCTVTVTFDPASPPALAPQRSP